MFKSDTKSDVANKFKSLTISVVASVLTSDTKSAVTNAISLTKSEVTNDIPDEKSDVISDALPATVVTFAEIPATVVTSDDIPATVVTLLDMPATVPMSVPSAATVVTSLAIPDTVVTSLAIPAIVVTSTEFMVVSTSPSLLKVNTLDALLAFAGSVTVADIESVSSNFTDLSDCWSISANFAYILSKSVLSDDISNDQAVGKSDVRSIEMSRIIVIISSAEAPVLPKVTVPPAPNS